MQTQVQQLVGLAQRRHFRAEQVHLSCSGRRLTSGRREKAGRAEGAPADYMEWKNSRSSLLLLDRISRLQHDLHIAFLVQLDGLRQVNSCQRNFLLLTVF
jgi:hypothetical protein